MAKLAPVGPASSTRNSAFEAIPAGMACLLHAVTGMVFYVVGYFLIARPLQHAVLPRLPWIKTAAL
jgi:hypothetical protein